MPKVNVYLPDALAAAVRAAGVPVSLICQQALEQAVADVDALSAAGARGVFSRFTERARHVMAMAEQEARREGEVEVHSGHVLIALSVADGLGARALAALGLSPASLREALSPIDGGERPEHERALASERRAHSGDAKRLVDASLQQATRLGHNYIGTEHLLLGVTAYWSGAAGVVLQSLGYDGASVRQRVIELMSGSAGAPPGMTELLDAGPPRSDRGELDVVPMVHALQAQVDALKARLDELDGGKTPPLAT